MSEETRIALLEQSIGTINQTLIRLERKMDDGFEKIDKKSTWLFGMILTILLSPLFPQIVLSIKKVFN